VQFHIPDPDYTGSERTRAHFRLAVKIAFGFVGLVWLIYLMNWALGQEPEPFGIRPRQLVGLPGIVFAPLVHDGFAHLIANSPPLLVLGTAMLFLYPNSALRVLPAVYFGTGIAVWLFGRDSAHFGASGLVYGLVSYIFVAGVLRRDRRAVAASLVVCFMYGSLAWGVLPTQAGVSWETHLAAALIGVGFALALRRLDVPPRKRYAWEGNMGEDENDEGNSRPRPSPDEPDRL
jgi:membrane associated rhomboid family serine protease